MAAMKAHEDWRDAEQHGEQARSKRIDQQTLREKVTLRGQAEGLPSPIPIAKDAAGGGHWCGGSGQRLRPGR